MKSIFFFIVVSFVFCSVFSRASDFSTVPEISSSEWDHVDLSIWAIKYFDNIEGTGFCLRKNRKKIFVTNFHVVSHGKEGSVEDITLLQEGNSSSLKVKKIVALSALSDLALLEIEGEITHCLSLGENPIESNALLFVSGYPRGVFKRMKKKGSILYEDSYSYTFFVNHLNLSSGSPVFDDERQVVGVAHQGGSNILTAIKINHFKKLVEGTTGLSCFGFIDPKTCIKQELENLKILAKQGNAQAQHNLAIMYNSGRGVGKNLEKAAFLWEQSAKQGNVQAQNNLAYMYSSGRGVEQNLEKAAFWYEQAATQGDVAAKYNLALMSYAGEGVAKSFEKAVFWYEQAATQGMVEAQSNLAYMYSSGKGVEQNLEKAVFWYEQAATQGDAKAQSNLEILQNQVDCPREVDSC